MNIEKLLERVRDLAGVPVEEPTKPPVALVALVVRWARSLKQWKVATLADFARVSVSTVERVERGENVNEEALDRIAQALGYETGTFTTPGLPLTTEETRAQFAELYGNMEIVKVRRMNSQSSVREAAGCKAHVIHGPGVPESYDTDIANLIEWLDFASFELSDLVDRGGGDVPRRKLYQVILDCVGNMERRGLTVLFGVVSAQLENLPDWTIAVISVTPRLSDPGAMKRTEIIIDRRSLNLSLPEWFRSGSSFVSSALAEEEW